MSLSKGGAVTIAVAAVVLAVTVISPALGGPSLRSLVKKEVAKQISKARGPQGLQGQQGPAGAAAAPPGGMLPAGTTLRGAFGPSVTTGATGGGVAGQGISFFGYSLAARPQVHAIGIGGNATTECPGSAAAPSAIAGHLCLYLSEVSSPGSGGIGDQLIVFDPVTSNGINFELTSGMTIAIGDGKVGTLGFQVKFREQEFNVIDAKGTWAVTG